MTGPCPICGDARGCWACRVPRLRARVDPRGPRYDPRYAATVAAMWRGEAAPSPPAPRDHFEPLRLARACDYSAGRPASCGCADRVVCLAGRGRGDDHSVHVTECVRCPLGGPVVR